MMLEIRGTRCEGWLPWRGEEQDEMEERNSRTNKENYQIERTCKSLMIIFSYFFLQVFFVVIMLVVLSKSQNAGNLFKIQYLHRNIKVVCKLCRKSELTTMACGLVILL